MVLRASGGPSILREELSDEQIAMDMDDAVRLNAAGVGIQVFIGGEHETRSVHNMTRLVDAGLRTGIPVMGITAVGKNMVRHAKYFRLACRIIAELGAQYVKTYYVEEGFETVTASCPVPIVMAGGKKLHELDALNHGLQRRAARRRRRRYGPQHFSIGCPKSNDRRHQRGRAQACQAERGVRAVLLAEREGLGHHKRAGESAAFPKSLDAVVDHDGYHDHGDDDFGGNVMADLATLRATRCSPFGPRRIECPAVTQPWLISHRAIKMLFSSFRKGLHEAEQTERATSWPSETALQGAGNRDAVAPQ